MTPGDGSGFFDPARRRSLGWRPLRRPWFRLLRRAVWRHLPRPVRQATLSHALARGRRPLAEGAPAAEPIAVVGLLATATGIGEAGRLTGRALAALGHDVLSVDISDLLQGEPAPPPHPPPLEPGPGTIVLHFNPDNLPAILTLLGRARLRGKRIVGYWAWELERIPSHWLPALAEVDEVWAPSRFVAEAVRPFTTKPVLIVAHPAALARPGTPRREAFGIGERFAVLSMFSFASYSRKNPAAAVRAFRAAFGAAEDRLLILKAIDGAAAPDEMSELVAAIGGAPNIRLDEGRMDEAERLDLLASVDALLSLHRSEGFGLVMAEAMLAGVPVIATGWSGNLDFMDDESALLVPCSMVPAADSRGVYAEGGRWAEPDVDAAAAHLRRLAANPADFAAMQERAGARAEQALGLAAFRRAIADAPLARPSAPVERPLERPARARGQGAEMGELRTG